MDAVWCISELDNPHHPSVHVPGTFFCITCREMVRNVQFPSDDRDALNPLDDCRLVGDVPTVVRSAVRTTCWELAFLSKSKAGR